MSFREVKLPSGAVLKIAPAPFAESKALYEALLEELRGISIGSKIEMGELIKNAFCVGFSSPKVSDCLWTCLGRCLYNDRKIDQDTFEPVKARVDYTTVCVEVAKENVDPFVKSLMQLYSQILASAESTPASGPAISPS